ncbi:MAG: translation elongation factor Ts [Bacteroidales bacterium]
MAEIKSADIVKLRKATGAGMMDCKKALQEAEGDFEKAIQVLRKKGQAIASKRASREATEGVVAARVKGNFGVIVGLNCETDFVAKNEEFVKLNNSILDLALIEKPSTLDSLKALQMDGKTLGEVVTEHSGKIGEKIEVGYYDFLEAEKVQAYNHFSHNLSTLVGFNKADVDDQVARDIAMQVAAMSPVAVDRDDVPEDIIAREKELGREKALQEGKPENIVDRIAEGMVNKFLKENTLLNQDFTKDSKRTVGQYLKEADKDLKVTGFKRFSVKD